MRIKNETDWDTADLRRIFALVLTRWNKIDDRKVPSKRLKHINVVNVRRSWRGPNGCAYVNSGSMWIRLPQAREDHRPLKVRELAFLFEHELAHCAGYHHDRMGPLNHWALVSKSERYAYVDGFTIRPKAPPKPKPKPDRQIERYKASVEALARWRTKLKRAQTGMKKYQAKVRRYEKALAADGRLAALLGYGSDRRDSRS